MNWTITGSNTVDYVRVTLSGAFCLASARSVISEVVELPLWNNGTALLVDNTKLEMDDISKSDIEFMTRMMERLNPRISKSKVAIVGNTDLQFGFARQFQLMAERYTGADIRAFRFEPAATEWLTTGNPFHDKLLGYPTPDFARGLVTSNPRI